jgi:DNA-directed RNA polymerase specialized sigma24 family protein
MLDNGLINRDSWVIRPSDGSRINLDEPPLLKQKWVLTPEAFDRLLSWLAPDREQAGERYEQIRSGLTRRFRQLGCAESEDLANVTIDRVAKKLPDIIATYEGDPTPYFFSVAYYVHMEYLKRPAVVPLDQTDPPPGDLRAPPQLFDDDESMDTCLRRCLEKLTQRSREMILMYYNGERQMKIKLRKELADRLGIKLTNLRLRAQRVRAELKKCILACLEHKTVA